MSQYHPHPSPNKYFKCWWGISRPNATRQIWHDHHHILIPTSTQRAHQLRTYITKFGCVFFRFYHLWHCFIIWNICFVIILLALSFSIESFSYSLLISTGIFVFILSPHRYMPDDGHLAAHKFLWLGCVSIIFYYLLGTIRLRRLQVPRR